jgi:hypothetical protein
MNFLLRPRIR